MRDLDLDDPLDGPRALFIALAFAFVGCVGFIFAVCVY